VLNGVTVDVLKGHPFACCLRFLKASQHHIDLERRLREYGGVHACVLELMPMGKTTILERKDETSPSGSAPLLVSQLSEELPERTDRCWLGEVSWHRLDEPADWRPAIHQTWFDGYHSRQLLGALLLLQLEASGHCIGERQDRSISIQKA
jgi:hypothetical protein